MKRNMLLKVKCILSQYNYKKIVRAKLQTLICKKILRFFKTCKIKNI